MCALCTFHLLYHRCTPPTNALSLAIRERESKGERPFPPLSLSWAWERGSLFPLFDDLFPSRCVYVYPPLCFRVCYVHGGPPSLSPLASVGYFGDEAPLFSRRTRDRERNLLYLCLHFGIARAELSPSEIDRADKSGRGGGERERGKVEGETIFLDDESCVRRERMRGEDQKTNSKKNR